MPILIEEELNEKINPKEVDEVINQPTIPSNYIEINLPSNGKIKGTPKSLHFRDFSASNAFDLDVSESERLIALVNALNDMCYEDFDVGELTPNDVNFILMTIHGNFIDNNIEKEVYIDESLPSGNEEGQLDYEDNIEKVTIPISSINFNKLGCDEKDKVIDVKFKLPFTITDKVNNSKIKLRFSTVKDFITSRQYADTFYKDEISKYKWLEKKLYEISDDDKLLDEFYEKNTELCEEYWEFIKKYNFMTTKIKQCLCIESYNGEECSTFEQKWNIYQNDISALSWIVYNEVVEKYSFGIQEKTKVFIESINQFVERRIPFQFDDFISFDKEKEDDRYILSFDD